MTGWLVLISHSFTLQSAEHVRKTCGWKGFQRTAYTDMWCPSNARRNCVLYALL
jgi:hypothetical protein